MSIHINAQKGQIAKSVLMPGDPLRAKFIAENFLQNSILVSNTRNILMYTGNYKNQKISIAASGMGCPSIGIYSYELYSEFNVESILRIGTCGAYYTHSKLFDIINTAAAASESTFAKYAWGIDDECIQHQGKIFEALNAKAQILNLPIINCNVHSSDIFYRRDSNIPQVAIKNNCQVVEMEAFSLFANAKYLNKQAGTLLTVSDIIPTNERISVDDREKLLLPMINLALETMINV